MPDIDILRIVDGAKERMDDRITEEVPFTIYVNDEELLTLLCSPYDLKELTVGFLYSSGLLKSPEAIEKVTIDSRNWAGYARLKDKEVDSRLLFKRMYTSGCGKGTLFYNAGDLAGRTKIESTQAVSSQAILKRMNEFQASSTTYKETGGVHSAAFATPEEIVILKEDIGRHNALDKVIGHAILKGLDLSQLLILTSGRISSEIVLKGHKAGSAFLVSRSAPTDQAIKMARQFHLTLIGFVRGKRMNVYSAEERVV